jgi:hypothetical protein
MQPPTAKPSPKAAGPAPDPTRPGRRSNQRLTDRLFMVGYVGLAGCGVPLWWRVWATGDTAGLSPWFLAIYAAALACLQVGFMRAFRGRPPEPDQRRMALTLIAGNALGLVNVLLALAGWCWAVWGKA